MYDFNPPMLALTDLRVMLRDYALSFTRKRDLPVILQVDGDDVEVPKKVRKAVFRVFEEGLNNAWQHAEAEKIEASLDLQPDRVHLEIRDDGVGFVDGPHPRRAGERGSHGPAGHAGADRERRRDVAGGVPAGRGHADRGRRAAVSGAGRRGSRVKIAIVGAGPAGCHLAHLLADTEHEILLFDHRVTLREAVRRWPEPARRPAIPRRDGPAVSAPPASSRGAAGVGRQPGRAGTRFTRTGRLSRGPTLGGRCWSVPWPTAVSATCASG